MECDRKTQGAQQKKTHILIHLYVGIVKGFTHILHQSMFSVAIIVPNPYLRRTGKNNEPREIQSSQSKSNLSRSLAQQ